MGYVHWTELVDESELNRTDRLALAWCRLNHGAWDPILGPKPEGFDNLPDYAKPNFFTRKRKACKHVHCIRAMRAIESIIGRAAVSRFHWIHGLGETEDAWLQWYVRKGFEFLK